MTARAMARKARATRLLGWTLMAAVCGFLLWIVFGGAAPLHDRIAGNIGPIASPEAVAEEGDVGRDITGRQLERLGGKDRP